MNDEQEKATIEYVLDYIKYFPVFPLVKGGVSPLKNSRGFHGATQDQEPLVKYFVDIEPEANVAASFIDTNYFVIDVDRKTPEKDGMVSINKIMPQGESLGDPVIVKTKSGKGVHLYYKTTTDIKHEIDWLDNVDILKNSCIMPPSKAPTITGEIGDYKFVKGTLEDVTEPPEWLLNAILSSQKEEGGSFTVNYNTTPRKPKYTALLLMELMEGVEEGNRSDWLTKQVGRLLYLGMDSETVYQWSHLINEQFVSPPLTDSEVNAMFKSLLKKEQKKRAREVT